MIAYLRGNIATIEPAHVVIDCQGVGYLVRISLNTYSRIKDLKEVQIFTYFQVREDAQILFGFADKKEQDLFELLISISGVGGNTALMILSSISAEELYQVISSEDVNALKRVKGIGAKTAGRIILELKDKLKLEDLGGSNKGGKTTGNIQAKRQEALIALTNLGLPKAAMEKRLDRIFKEEGPGISIEQAIKLALRNP